MNGTWHGQVIDEHGNILLQSIDLIMTPGETITIQQTITFTDLGLMASAGASYHSELPISSEDAIAGLQEIAENLS